MSSLDLHLDAASNMYLSGSYNSFASLPIGTFTLPQIPGNKFFFAKTAVVIIPTGMVEPMQVNGSLILYPNPAYERVNIDVDNIKHNNDCNYSPALIGNFI